MKIQRIWIALSFILARSIIIIKCQFISSFFRFILSLDYFILVKVNKICPLNRFNCKDLFYINSQPSICSIPIIIGLVEKIRRGLGQPDIIYIKNFITSDEDKKESLNADISTEVGKTDFKRSEKLTSGGYDIYSAFLIKPLIFDRQWHSVKH